MQYITHDNKYCYTYVEKEERDDTLFYLQQSNENGVYMHFKKENFSRLFIDIWLHILSF